ncbi:Pilus biogenesis protein [Ectopseudomonas oleovorans]|uniref:Pilus biogenesis protein n=1 Tax=Ectopseudomonas oleovorans TaxID=301 RepID=A0A653B7V7_ECTOL|nr:Pilus biogenesis protein [Pseudomonas oleovorans]
MSEASARPTWLMLIGLLCFALSSLAVPFSGYGWHDQQRIAQLLLLVIACGVVLFSRLVLGGRFVWLLLLILALGLVSAALAEFPIWAMREWALQAGLIILSLLLAHLLVHESRQWAVIYLAASVGGVLVVQFFVGYAAAFLSGIRILDAFTLFSGFSNPRFLGQFQVMLIPLLAGVTLHQWGRRSGWAALVAAVLVGQWCIAYALGGRGLVLGVLIASSSLLLLGVRFFRFWGLQLFAALMGLLLYWLLFVVVPEWLEMVPASSGVLRSGLSAREILWGRAWELASANPWIGVGPMHFSARANPVAAHPHQMLLQWASEWGVPVAVLVLALMVWGVGLSARFLRHQHQSVSEIDVALWVALLGCLVLAQVDGVFVMPYTQTWMAVLVGMALARWSSCRSSSGPQSYLIMCVSLLALGVLAHVLMTDALALPENLQRFFDLYAYAGRPRFWSQGWIAGQ